MKEQIISRKTAILAMEIGFNHGNDGYHYYNTKSGEMWTNTKGGISGKEKTYKKCTQSLLQKWLREKHNLHIKIMDYGDGIHFWTSLTDLKLDPERTFIERLSHIYYNKNCQIKFDKYEKALEVGLYDALKIIKKRK